jgi:hypothetical protein
VVRALRVLEQPAASLLQSPSSGSASRVVTFGGHEPVQASVRVLSSVLEADTEVGGRAGG